MSLENLNNKKEVKKHTNWIEAGALATAMLLQSHPNAKALEIPAETPWVTGIQENIRQSVKQEKFEHLFTYLKFDEGQSWSKEYGKWLPTKVGAMMTVGPEYDASAKQIRELSLEETRRLKKICIGHTHPAVGVGTFHFDVKNLDALPAPPSVGDIKAAGQNGLRSIEGQYKMRGIESKPGFYSFEYFEADQRGIWYYRRATDADYKTPEEKELAKKMLTSEATESHWKQFEALALKSEVIADFTQLEEYKKLQQSYKINVGGMVRFVPYDKIANEPLCAGVDFDSATTKQPQQTYISHHTN